MATGFVQRFKGRVAFAWLGLNQGGGQAIAVFYATGAPVNGTSGTLAGIARPGALLVTSEPAFYQNLNTLASPTWTALTTATGAGTYTGNFDGIIGATTPADADFTTVDASGAVSVGGALTASSTLNLTGACTLGAGVTMSALPTVSGAAGTVYNSSGTLKIS